MSSDSDDFIAASDDDESEFEIEEGEESDDDDDNQLLENLYYGGKQEEDPMERIKELEGVISTENDLKDAGTLQEYGKWGFKSIKQICKVMYKQKMYDELVKTMKRLLGYQKHVSRNVLENGINKILFLVADDRSDKDFLLNIYRVVIDFAWKSGNEKLWFYILYKLANILIKRKLWGDFDPIVKDLKKWCAPNGVPEKKKATNFLEVSVLEMQRYMDTLSRQSYTKSSDATKRLKELYISCRDIEKKEGVVVSNPNINGIISEVGGLMYMREKQYAKAYHDFFDVFRNYDDGGSPRKLPALKYFLVVAMLRSADEGAVIDPFDSPEVKPYSTHKEIKGLKELMDKFKNNDIIEFDRCLKKDRMTREFFENDAFIKSYVEELIRNVRYNVLLVATKAYRRVTLKYLAKILGVTQIDIVEGLLCDLVLDGKLKASIDQIHGLVDIESVNRDDSTNKRYNALNGWMKRMKSIQQSVINKID